METRNIDKSSGLLRLAMVVLCAFFLTALTVGCDDESSDESKFEEARIAIDEGQYKDARDILKGLPATQQVLEMLACAYAGLSGIDSFEILSELDDDGGKDDGSLDLIGKVLGTGADDSLPCGEISTKLTYTASAKDNLIASVGSVSLLDPDGKAKLAIYGFTDFVYVLGEILCLNYGDRVTPEGVIVLTEAWISSLENGGDFSGLSVTGAQLARMNQDLAYVQGGIEPLGGGNDLAEEFAAFRKEIDPESDGIDEAALISYLNGLGK